MLTEQYSFPDEHALETGAKRELFSTQIAGLFRYLGIHTHVGIFEVAFNVAYNSCQGPGAAVTVYMLFGFRSPDVLSTGALLHKLGVHQYALVKRVPLD